MVQRTTARRLQPFEQGQAVLAAHHIAGIELPVVLEAVDGKGIVADEEAALEAVALPHGGVAARDGAEPVVALKLDDAFTVGQPSYAEPVADAQLSGADGVLLLHELRLASALVREPLAEIAPVFEAGVAAEHVERPPVDRVVTADAAPEPAQRILRDVLAGDPLDIASQLRVIVAALHSVSETLLDGHAESRELWYVGLYCHNGTKVANLGIFCAGEPRISSAAPVFNPSAAHLHIRNMPTVPGGRFCPGGATKRRTCRHLLEGELHIRPSRRAGRPKD